MTGDSLL